jgi:hypothetical protein
MRDERLNEESRHFAWAFLGNFHSLGFGGGDLPWIDCIYGLWDMGVLGLDWTGLLDKVLPKV